ncbi:MAG: hypothetical protein ACKOCX_05305 [Planctomycetota bacterium]
MPTAVIRPVRSRLVSQVPRGGEIPPRRQRVYRPLVVGPAVLRRHGPGEPWTAVVSTDGRLWPEVPPGLGRRPRWLLGGAHRVAAALVAPQDLDGRPVRLIAERRPTRSEFYGWALLYQLPGMRGLALADTHERFSDLPALFESPAELVDRTTFLASKGVVSRPLALFTQPADFVVTAEGELQNRFYPGERFHRPADLGWFW